MIRLLLLLLFFIFPLLSLFSKEEDFNFNINQQINLFSGPDINIDNTNDKKINSEIIVMNSFYIFGSILPITNVLGLPYFMLFGYIRSMNEVFMILYMTPLGICGLLSRVMTIPQSGNLNSPPPSGRYPYVIFSAN